MKHKTTEKYKALLNKVLSNPVLTGKKAVNSRIKTGITGLDSMLGGGFIRGSIVTIAGSSGSGKTVLGLQALLVRKFTSSEKGKIYTFDEKAEEISAMIKTFGFEHDKNLSVSYHYPVAQERDRLFEDIFSSISSGNVKHLLINSISSILDLKKEADLDFFRSLIALFKHFNVSVFLNYLSQGDSVAFSKALADSPLTGLSDAVLLLDFPPGSVENRSVFVFKMRNARVERKKWHFDMTSTGIKVQDPSKEKDGPPAKEIVINSIGFDDIAIDKLVTAEVEKKNPAYIFRIVQKEDPFASDYFDRFKKKLETGGQSTDIVFCRLSEVKKFAAEGLISPLGHYFETEAYYPEAIKGCFYKNRLYAIPSFIVPYCLIYRKDLLDKYGMKAPESLEDMAEKAMTIMETEKQIKNGFLIPGNNSFPVIALLSLALADEPEDVDKQENFLKMLSSPRVFKFLSDCIHKYRIMPKETFTSADIVDGMQDGNTLFGLHWGYSDFNYRGSQIIDLKEKVLEYIPVPGKDKRKRVFMEGTAFVFMSTCKYPMHASEALRIIASFDVDRQVHMMGNYVTLSGRKDVNRFLERTDKRYSNAAGIIGNGMLVKDLIYDRKIIEIVSDCLGRIRGGTERASKIAESAENSLNAWAKTESFSDRISSGIKYMENNYDKKIGTKEIAGIVGLSPDYFEKVFKAKIGVTVHAYLTGIRLEKAKSLLSEGNDHNISQVAVKSGFKSVFHFSSSFKKLTGSTPSQFRVSHILNSQK